jgi:hypothetical protein
MTDVNQKYYRWMNDPEVTQYLESRFYPNSMEALQDYVIGIESEKWFPDRRESQKTLYLQRYLYGCSDAGLNQLQTG